jgi:predicted DNA-binding transcriptional regulator AlpA/DNA-binding Xre family transcriptional regulator
MHLDILNIMDSLTNEEADATPLQAWMSKKGLKDGQVAEQVGLSRTQVSRIRRGFVGASVPAAKRLEKLTGIHHWRFLAQSDRRSGGQFAIGTSVARGARPKFAARGAAVSAERGGEPSVLSGPHPLELALTRNTLATEKLAAAIRTLSKRLDQSGRSERAPPGVTKSRRQIDDQLLSMAEVTTLFGGVSSHTIYRMIQRGHLPRPIKIQPRISRWRKSDCERALQELSEREINI